MTQLNSKGEVADVLDVSQFIGGRSAYECVSYSASLIYFSGEPGHGPTGSVLEASNLAQYWYAKEEGSTDASNTNGMSLQAEYNMLQGMGLKYQGVSPWIGAIKAVLQEGLPLMLCGAETGMYDVGLGDRIPYSWSPSGNHCVVVSGIAPDGNLLVHDCASIAPTGVRSGPRIYDASKLQIVSATAVTPRWKGNQSMSGGVPKGWHDDGHTLTAPNGVKVVLGFRDYILASAWDETNVPLAPQYYTKLLEQANPDLGMGDQIVFLYGDALGYPHNPTGAMAGLKNKVIREWMGKELNLTRDMLAKYYPLAKQAADLQAQIATREKELQQAQFDLAAEKSKSGNLTIHVQQTEAQLAQEQAQIKTLQAELQGKPDLSALSNRLSAIGMNIKQAETYLTEAQNQAAQPIS